VVAGDGLGMDQYEPHQHGGPLHLINVTLNETVDGRSQIEQRDRKGLGMALGPGGVTAGVQHHAYWRRKVADAVSGCIPSQYLLLAERKAPGKYWMFTSEQHEFLKDHPNWCAIDAEPLRLEQWVGISGAAFSTGVGARTSLGLSLLTGMFNVRLGYWWNSGVRPRSRDVKTKRGAVKQFGRFITWLFPVQMHLLDELTARFHGSATKHWYISEGGTSRTWAPMN
jgi:hypothetical protein